MRIKVVVLCLILPFASSSQIKYKVNEIDQRGISGFQVQYRTALILVKSVRGKDTVFNNGCGFILNNRYLATCYHVYKKDSSFHPIEVKVYYNINARDKPKDKRFVCDSVFATLDYRPTRKQYDFRKHIYKTGDTESDFIILKLEKKVNALPPIFDTTSISTQQDQYVASGFTNDRFVFEKDTSYSLDFSSTYQTVFITTKTKNNSVLLFSYGGIRPGYSGSPLFSKDGKIIGVAQKAFDKDYVEAEIMRMFSSNAITFSQYDEIIKFVRQNQWGTIGISTNISYLLNTYMKGYF